jgi:hypothetical protein
MELKFIFIIKKENIMKLNAPTKIIWIISLILGLLGVLGMITTIPFVSAYSVWFVVVGWVLIILATVLKGM